MHRIALCLAVAASTATAQAQVSAQLSDFATVQSLLIDESIETFTQPDESFPIPSTQSFSELSVQVVGSDSDRSQFRVLSESLLVGLDPSNGGLSFATFQLDKPSTVFAAEITGSLLAFEINGEFIQLTPSDIPGYVSSGFVSFSSTESFDSVSVFATSLDPTLRIDDIIYGNIPAPSTAALAGLAGALCLRRRAARCG